MENGKSEYHDLVCEGQLRSALAESDSWSYGPHPDAFYQEVDAAYFRDTSSVEWNQRQAHSGSQPWHQDGVRRGGDIHSRAAHVIFMEPCLFVDTLLPHTFNTLLQTGTGLHSLLIRVYAFITWSRIINKAVCDVDRTYIFDICSLPLHALSTAPLLSITKMVAMLCSLQQRHGARIYVKGATGSQL